MPDKSVTTRYALFKNDRQVSIPSSWFDAMRFAAENDCGYFITSQKGHLNDGYQIKEIA